MKTKPIWERLNVELLATQVAAWLPSLLAAIIILVFFWLFFRVTRPAIRRVLTRSGFDEALTGMVLNVYRFVVLAFGIVMAASQLGINVGAALAGLGVVGLTIGFAAKDSLSNIMAGFLIFWDKPFHVGNWITVGDHYGKISEITMRTTRLQTRDNKWVIIPNEKVINEILINHSTNGATRLQVPVGISYADDIPTARGAILNGLRQVDYVIDDPAPAVVVNDLGGSSVDLLVFAWIADAKDEKPAFFAVVESIKAALDAAGIQMPFPQLDLSLVNVRKEVWEQAGEMARREPKAITG